MPITHTYTQMSDIYLTNVPWDRYFNNVYYPTALNKSKVKAEGQGLIAKYKNEGNHFSGCRPVRSSNFFILNIPYEEAKKYNYVVYRDNDVLFRRGVTDTTVSKEVPTYDVTTGCIEITFKEESAPENPVEYVAYKYNDTYQYWDYEGTRHEINRTYENQYKRTGGTVVERYAFIETFVPINDFLTGFSISCDYWMQYVVFGHLHFEKRTLFKRMSVKADGKWLWRMPEQITPVRYIQSDEQFADLLAYCDAYGTWHSTGSSNIPQFARDNSIMVAFCTDLDAWSEGNGTSGTTYKTIGTWVTETYNTASWDGDFSGSTVIGIDERTFLGNAYNGLYALVFSKDCLNSRINAMITANIGQVLNVVTMPATMIHTIVSMHNTSTRASENNRVQPVLIGRVPEDGTERFQGYVPRHNKQYLENFIYVADGSGTTNCFRLGDFKDGSVVFRAVLPFAPDAVISITPCNYNRKCIENAEKSIYVRSEYFTPNYTFTFCTSPIPNSSFTSNAYQAYLAQNGGLDNMYKQVQLSNAMVTNNAMLSNAQYNLTENQNILNGKLNEATLDYNLATYNSTSLSNVANTINGALGGYAEAMSSSTTGNSASILSGSANMATSVVNGVATQYQADNTWKYNQENYGIQQNLLNASSEFCEYAKEKISANANCQKQQNELALQMSLSGAKAVPDSGVTGTNLQTAHDRRFGVYIWESTWSWIDANILDEFFDKYGYHVCEYIDVGDAGDSKYYSPIVGHKYHDYVETQDCKLYRDDSFKYISDEEISVIETILNSGVHIWHDVDYIYQYGSTNTRVSTVDGYTLLDGVSRYSGDGF